MKIKSAKFIVSQSDWKQCKSYNMPEIAIAGKSNVGKSSFINFLANINRLAKTSSTPGRTRLLNYFEINNGEVMLVDLPGYGFAKVGGSDKDSWSELIGGYLLNSKNLAYVFVLVDIRHEPSALDKQMIAYLHHNSIPFGIIATKSDKLSRAQIDKQRQVIASCLAMGKSDILVCSAEKKTGLDSITDKIQCVLENYKYQQEYVEEDDEENQVDSELDESNNL